MANVFQSWGLLLYDSMSSCTSSTLTRSSWKTSCSFWINSFRLFAIFTFVYYCDSSKISLALHKCGVEKMRKYKLRATRRCCIYSAGPYHHVQKGVRPQKWWPYELHRWEWVVWGVTRAKIELFTFDMTDPLELDTYLKLVTFQRNPESISRIKNEIGSVLFECLSTTLSQTRPPLVYPVWLIELFFGQ